MSSPSKTRAATDKINNLEKKQEDRFDKVMTALLNIASKFNKFDEEEIVLKHQIRRNTDRIEVLESKVLPS